jgi:hypothetical protein
MPTLSSTIQMIRENTNFDCNMRLEEAAKARPATPELAQLEPSEF